MVQTRKVYQGTPTEDKLFFTGFYKATMRNSFNYTSYSNFTRMIENLIDFQSSSLVIIISMVDF
jgi:hypothetical protein